MNLLLMHKLFISFSFARGLRIFPKKQAVFAGGAPAVFSDDAGFPNDAVAGDKKSDGICADRRADGAGSFWFSQRTRDRSVRFDRAGRNIQKRLPYFQLKRRSDDEYRNTALSGNRTEYLPNHFFRPWPVADDHGARP